MTQVFEQWHREAIADGCTWARDPATARRIYASLTPATKTAENTELARLRIEVLKLKRYAGPRGIFEDALLQVVRQLRKDLATVDSDLQITRQTLNMPVIKRSYRVKAGTGRSW